MRTSICFVLCLASSSAALDLQREGPSQLDLQVANLKATIDSAATIPIAERGALLKTVENQIKSIAVSIEAAQADPRPSSRAMGESGPVGGTSPAAEASPGLVGTVTGVGKQLLGTVGGLLSPVTGLLGGLLSGLGLGGLGNVVSEIGA